MGKFLHTVLFLSLANFSIAQETPTALLTDGFSYPTFLNGDSYANFSVEYPLNTDLEVELRGFYQRNSIGERFRLSLILKKYLPNQKTYFLGGAQMEWEFWTQAQEGSRADILFGAGHQFDKNLTIEGILQVPLINSSIVNPLGTGKTGSGFFNLGSKFKL